MSLIRKHSRLLLVAVCCASAGAGASVIAGAGAAAKPGDHASAKSAHAHQGVRSRRAKGLRGLTRRAVQGEVVVHTAKGFTDVTFNRGVVDSVSGQQLKLTEGTRKASYKTVTLTIPADARVRDDRRKSSLADVKPGQRVLVVHTPKRTIVVARTPGAAPAAAAG